MEEEYPKLRQLVTTYQSPGFKYLEEWLNIEIDRCVKEMMNPRTPSDNRDRLCMEANAYQSVLDKVKGDIDTLLNNERQQG